MADFLGTANVLKGKFVAADGEIQFAGESGIKLALDRDATVGQGTVILRPQNLAIYAARAPAVTAGSALQGTIRYVEFLGSIVRYAVQVGSQEILVDQSHSKNEKILPTGAKVEVLFDPRSAVTLTQ